MDSNITPRRYANRQPLARWALLLVGLLAGATCAAAADYPNRPIEMVLGFAPGGGTDVGSKIVADKMREFLGQPLISVYKPGGGGAIATSWVARGKQDGYTVLATNHSVFSPPEVKKVDYSMADFVSTGAWMKLPNFITVSVKSKWRNLKEFVEDAKKEPGKYSLGHGGTFSATHFWYMFFAKSTGVKLSLVPYKSCGEALTALMGGHVDASTCPGLGVTDNPLVRTLAVGEEKRLPDLPDVPTVMEFGYPVSYTSLYTFLFPKGTPADIIKKFSEAQKNAQSKYAKEIADAFGKVQMYPANLSGEETMKEYQVKYDQLRALLKEFGPADQK